MSRRWSHLAAALAIPFMLVLKHHTAFNWWIRLIWKTVSAPPVKIRSILFKLSIAVLIPLDLCRRRLHKQTEKQITKIYVPIAYMCLYIIEVRMCIKMAATSWWWRVMCCKLDFDAMVGAEASAEGGTVGAEATSAPHEIIIPIHFLVDNVTTVLLLAVNHLVQLILAGQQNVTSSRRSSSSLLPVIYSRLQRHADVFLLAHCFNLKPNDFFYLLQLFRQNDANICLFNSLTINFEACKHTEAEAVFPSLYSSSFAASNQRWRWRSPSLTSLSSSAAAAAPVTSSAPSSAFHCQGSFKLKMSNKNFVENAAAHILALLMSS